MGQQRTHWPDGALCFPQGGAAVQFVEAVEGSYLCETVDLILAQFRDSQRQIINTRERFISPGTKHCLPCFLVQSPSVSEPKPQVSSSFIVLWASHGAQPLGVEDIDGQDAQAVPPRIFNQDCRR